MKVEIGPYLNWIGPYQIAEILMFWAKDKVTGEKSENVHKFGTWLAQDKNGNESYLTRLCEWIQSKRKRKVKIRIDRFDSWNADTTLAMIILPVLKQLQATKNGSGFTDDEDVPDELKSTSAPPLENEWDTDANFHKRFEWILNEIIWTFEQLQPECDWEDQYWIVKPEMDISDHAEDADSLLKPVRWAVKGQLDQEGRAAHQARITNGLKLFGKYYENLWD